MAADSIPACRDVTPPAEQEPLHGQLWATLDILIKKQTNNAMELCHEYLGCHNADCPMHAVGRSKPCWQVEDTMCNHHGIKLVRQMTDGNKEAACARSACIYYSYAKSIENLRSGPSKSSRGF